jgi:hypothetical protein
MTDAAAVAYNPFEPGFAEDPYQQYRAMREHEPVRDLGAVRIRRRPPFSA